MIDSSNVVSFFLQPSYLHTDFNRWRDEDDSEEEDTAMDDNFEAVSKVILRTLLKEQILYLLNPFHRKDIFLDKCTRKLQ